MNAAGFGAFDDELGGRLGQRSISHRAVLERRDETLARRKWELQSSDVNHRMIRRFAATQSVWQIVAEFDARTPSVLA
jgi:hypothetical protein